MGKKYRLVSLEAKNLKVCVPRHPVWVVERCPLHTGMVVEFRRLFANLQPIPSAHERAPESLAENYGLMLLESKK